MTYNRNLNLATAIEIEFIVPNNTLPNGKRISRRLMRPLIDAINISEVYVTYDYTRCENNSDHQVYEINMPLQFYDYGNSDCKANNLLTKVRDALKAINAETCTCTGLHVHVSLNPLKDNVNPQDFNTISQQNWYRNNAENNKTIVLDLLDSNKRLPILAIQDFIIRYYDDISEVEKIVAPSRNGINNHFCKYPESVNPDWKDILKNTTTYDGLSEFHNNNKFFAINCLPIDSKNTIEFRQHHGQINQFKIFRWIKLITNMINHTMINRIETRNSPTIVFDDIEALTPDQLFPNARANDKGKPLYELLFTHRNITTELIMRNCGFNTPNSVRRKISELRQKLQAMGINGQSAITTYNQQCYDNPYGASNGAYDLNGYGINDTWQKKTIVNGGNTLALKSDDEIGLASIFSGLDYDTVHKLTHRT